MNRGAWQAVVHRVSKSWTCLKQLSMHTCMCVCVCVWLVMSRNKHVHGYTTREPSIQIPVSYQAWFRLSNQSPCWLFDSKDAPSSLCHE